MKNIIITALILLVVLMFYMSWSTAPTYDYTVTTISVDSVKIYSLLHEKSVVTTIDSLSFYIQE